MLDILCQMGRPEMVVGWYHSHPGFGCWLSGVDITTRQSFEALSDRAVAVHPIQSIKAHQLQNEGPRAGVKVNLSHPSKYCLKIL